MGSTIGYGEDPDPSWWRASGTGITYRVPGRLSSYIGDLVAMYWDLVYHSPYPIPQDLQDNPCGNCDSV
ncbi:hypothetical protein G9A89_000330 [Geosiphon pyriformis]|nr:hypothetical protein G9A89_000330 [Geosiphon pyriformis]